VIRLNLQAELMRRYALRNDQWERVAPLLPGKENDPGRTATDNRLFVEAVLWIARTGAPWRDLPERYGKWNSVYQRFNRWAKAGVWEQVFDTLQDPDLEWLMIDTTVVRAHQHAAGQKK
jgi:putative transposase